MTRLERLTTRYWRASTHLRRRHQDPALADWEAWGLLADLQHRRTYPRLARAAESFLFPRRSPTKKHDPSANPTGGRATRPGLTEL